VNILNPIDGAWMLLKEVTLEDLRQAARTGGLPDTPERRAASDGHPGIPAALSGVEPFMRTRDGRSTGTAGQAVAERIMDAQRGRLNEFGQSLEEGYDSTALRDLSESMRGNADNFGSFDIDQARHGNDPEMPGFDDSMPDPMTIQPPEVSAAIDPDHSEKLLSRLLEQQPEGPDADYEAIHQENMDQYGPARNRYRGEEYGPFVQNPKNYNRRSTRPMRYDPFPLENRVQTQEPVDDTEFADLSRPPEGRNPAQMQQLGQELADFPAFPEGVEQDYDLRDEQESALASRAKTLASQSAQQSTASPMDAAMQALGNRKTEQSARVPAPVQRRALNTRRGGRGRGPNSQRNRGR
jgi:hypothetical protein